MAMLQVAKLNLKEYYDVGIVEELDDFAYRMRLQLPKRYLNMGESYAEDLKPETAKLLRRTQELDMQLYELARKLSAERAGRVSNSTHKAAGDD